MELEVIDGDGTRRRIKKTRHSTEEISAQEPDAPDAHEDPILWPSEQDHPEADAEADADPEQILGDGLDEPYARPRTDDRYYAAPDPIEDHHAADRPFHADDLSGSWAHDDPDPYHHGPVADRAPDEPDPHEPDAPGDHPRAAFRSGPIRAEIGAPGVTIAEESTDPLDVREPGTPCLVLVTADGEERSYPLGDLNILVGRSRSADIVTEGDGVALFHVRIEPTEDGRHRVIDLDARSGTLLNGEPIEQAVLEPGDVLMLGDTELRYTRGLGSLRNPPAVPSSVRPSVAIRSPKDRSALVEAASTPGVLAEVEADSELLLSSPLAAELPMRTTSAQVMRPGTGPVATLDAPEPDVIDRLAQMVAFWRRYRVLLLGLPVLGLLLGVLSPRVVPPAMVARFELSLVQDPSDNPAEAGPRRNLTFFRSARDNFLGPELIERTLEQLGDPEPDPQAIAHTQELLDFERTSQFIYRGSYEAEEAENAVAFLEVHLALFLETEVDKAIKVLTAEVDTLKGQLAQIDEELTTVETTRVAFKMEAGEAQPEHTLALQRRMLDLRDDRREAASMADRLGATVDIARQRLGSEDKLIEQRIADARPFSDEIVATEKELITARAKGLGDEHPNVKGLEARLQGLEDRHQKLLDEGGARIEVRSNPAYAKAKMSLTEARSLHKVARTDLARTNAEIEQLEKVLEELPAREAEQAALDRRYDALKQQHNELQLRLGSSELQLALERRQVEARFDLVQPPTLEPRSDHSVMLTRAGLGTLTGLVLAVMLGLGHTTWERVGQRLAEQQAGSDPTLDALSSERALAVRTSPRPISNRYRAVERKRRVTRTVARDHRSRRRS